MGVNVASGPKTHGSASVLTPGNVRLVKPNAGGVSPVLPTNEHGVTTQQSFRAHAKVDHPVISAKSHGVSGTSAGKAGLSAHAAAEAAVLAQQQQYRNACPSSAQGYAAQAQAPGLQAHAAAEAA